MKYLFKITKIFNRIKEGVLYEAYTLGCNRDERCCERMPQLAEESTRVCCNELCNKITNYDRIPTSHAYLRLCKATWTLVYVLIVSLVSVTAFLVAFFGCFRRALELMRNCCAAKKRDESSTRDKENNREELERMNEEKIDLN